MKVKIQFFCFDIYYYYNNYQINLYVTCTGAITNQTEISDYEEDEFQNEDINQDLEDDQVASQEDSDVDDITIASLIEQGKLKSKNIELPENKAAELKDVLNKPIIKVKDLVK